MSPVKNAVANPAPIGIPIAMQRRSKATTFLKGACTYLFHVVCVFIVVSPHGKFLLPILHLCGKSSENEEIFSKEDLKESLRLERVFSFISIPPILLTQSCLLISLRQA